MSEQDNIGDDVRAAIQASEATNSAATPSPSPTPAPSPEPTPTPYPAPSPSADKTTASDRDESGRFKAKDTTDPEAAAPSPAPTATPAATPAPTATEQGNSQWTQDKAPQSWTPAAREKWEAIDPEVRQQILRREEAAVNGVRQLHERFAPVQETMNTIGPFMQEIVQGGQNPHAYLQATLESERNLRAPNIPDRFNELLRIADAYQIPLREIINKSVGEEVLGPLSKPQTDPAIQAELNEIRTWRAQQEQREVESVFTSFANDPQNEFFHDVKGQMADLIESGVAKSLPDAYEQAIWANPQTRAILISRQGQQQQQPDPVAERQKAAAGTSVKPSGKVQAVSPLDDEEEDDIATTVRKAAQLHSGRA